MSEEGLMMQSPVEAESYAPVALEAGTDTPVPPARNAFARRSAAFVATALLAGAAVLSVRKQVSVAPVTGDSLIGESALRCEYDGSTNCMRSKCCVKANQFCFEKDQWWAACRESCVKGHHYLDPREQPSEWSCKPLGGPPPPCGQRVRLLSRHKKFLTAEQQDGAVKADREHANEWEEFGVECTGDGLVALMTFHRKYLKIDPYKEPILADATKADTWEKFLWVTHSDGTISLQAHTGNWLRVTDKHVVRADSPRVSDWEKFTVIGQNNFQNPPFGCSKCGEGFCMIANRWPALGKQCCACKGDGKCAVFGDFTNIDNAKCSSKPTVDANQCAKDGSEDCRHSKCCQKSSERCFEKNEHWASCRESCVPGVHGDDPKEHQQPWSCRALDGQAAPTGKWIWLQSFHKKYLSVERDGGHVKADRSRAQDWEKFFVKDMGKGGIALKGYFNKFVQIRPDAADILADTWAADKWETFQWIDNRDGTFSLQAHTGKFVRATPEGKVFADSSKISDWEKFSISMVP